MNGDMVRTIKGFESEFLDDNLELYKDNKMEFLRKREEFVNKKLEEMKEEDEEE